jgi:hypothetical protein
VRFMMALLGWTLLAVDSLLHSGFFALLGLSLVIASVVAGYRQTKRQEAPGPNTAVDRSVADRLPLSARCYLAFRGFVRGVG